MANPVANPDNVVDITKDTNEALPSTSPAVPELAAPLKGDVCDPCKKAMGICLVCNAAFCSITTRSFPMQVTRWLILGDAP